GPRASSRIASLVVAERLKHEVGIEPILHFCCRDRNLIGMQADLLASAACDIHNILFITGDPPKVGKYPDVTGVFDTDSIGMIRVQTRLNRGLDIGQEPIKPATNVCIGCGLDPTSLDKEREIARFRQKVEAGAHFAVTQPVFDFDAFCAFLDQIGDTIPIIAGVWPLTGYKNALFMKNEVPGVVVPDSVMARMEAIASQDAASQLALGIEIAQEAIERIRLRVCGVQVSAPFGRIEPALSLLNLS
ncbi:MAG: methylenetetrahydrofolate reductase, partial [Planctomycetia bacterium]|nr:methylenetetrahydrofolate reductase [Planctomycetia bacterium]